MFAVTGATGQLGGLIIEGLVAKVGAEAVVALARTPEKADGLGVAVRAFDYNAPETLAASLAGIETLMLVSGSEIGQREPQHRAVIAAAVVAGVSRIVYTSLLKADVSTLALAPEHVATEAALKDSGLAYTILRNSWYTENYVPSVLGALEHGALVGAASEGKIASATRADYAAAAVAVLTGAGHEGKTYELAGDAAFTLADMAVAISAAAGKEVPFVNMPVEEFAKVLEGAGLAPEMAGFFAALDTGIAAGDLDWKGSDLSDLIGRPTTPMADTVAGLVQ